MSDDFDWDAATADGHVVVPDQAAIACYINPFGNVVLRQEGQYPEEDTWIVCQPIYVEALAIALLRAAGRTDLVIVPVSQTEIVRKDGDRLMIPQGDIKKTNPIGREMRVEERQNQKDPTAAERKRRQRQRERDGESNADVASVTPAGPVTVTPESVTGRVVSIQPPASKPEGEAPSKQSTPPTEMPEQKPPTAPPKAAERITSGPHMTRADYLRQRVRQEEEAAAKAAKAKAEAAPAGLFEEESEPRAHAR
jgi:hypothetical protein